MKNFHTLQIILPLCVFGRRFLRIFSHADYNAEKKTSATSRRRGPTSVYKSNKNSGFSLFGVAIESCATIAVHIIAVAGRKIAVVAE